MNVVPLICSIGHATIGALRNFRQHATVFQACRIFAFHCGLSVPFQLFCDPFPMDQNMSLFIPDVGPKARGFLCHVSGRTTQYAKLVTAHFSILASRRGCFFPILMYLH